MAALSRQRIPRAIRKLHRAKLRLLPVMSGAAIAGAAIAAVAYLLWPTWHQAGASTPGRIPVSVGETLFNVPVRAFRVKVQTHSGPQDRVDLAFLYPSLAPPEPARHISAEKADQGPPPIDRVFLSIIAHGGSLAPDVRVRTIYPRYLDAIAMPAQDGLLTRSFRDGSPYSGEDLFYASTPNLVARCTRDGGTVGMCLSERRAGNADLTFRFPRAWLSQWRDVATAMDRLTMQLRDPKGS
jgi:hypothetical protein